MASGGAASNMTNWALNSTAMGDQAVLSAYENPSTAAGAQQYIHNNVNNFILCYSPTMITTNGFWKGDNPLNYSFPLFILQSILIIVVTRGLNVILHRLHQPRFISEIIGGIILGPSVLGFIPGYMETLFPTRSLAVLETVACLGLIFFIFLSGLQMDLSVVSRPGKQAWAVTSAGIMFPIIIEMIGYFIFKDRFPNKDDIDAFLVFVGMSLSITACPVLARILAELKLLYTDTGKLAMSVAILNDGIAWVLLGVGLALSGNHKSYVAPAGIVFSGIMLAVLLYFTIRPAANWVMAQTKEGEAIDEIYVLATLVLVMLVAVLAECVGVHAVFGVFLLGIVIPSGSLGNAMVEKLEDFNAGFMLPLFFGGVGINVNLATVTEPSIYGFLISVILIGAAAKVGAVALVSKLYAMPIREGLSLGVLMNTKGLMELIVLSIAFDKKALYRQSYSLMVMMSILLTAISTPLVMWIHGPVRHFVAYKRRTIQKARPNAELRMVACIHNTRNVPSLISLLDISHPTKRSPIFVFAAHLVELTARESAMLIVHENTQESGRRHGSGGGGGGHGNINFLTAQSDQIIMAFESYEQQASGISVKPVTVVSSYSTMHDDVCNLAEDKHAALIILPFHKQHTVDGEMEVLNPGILTLNQHVLANAPCSIGILVDRGLGATARVTAGHHASHKVALLFIGGPDDREALAYVARMADHPDIHVTVIRFVEGNHVGSLIPAQPSPEYARVVNVPTENDRDRLLDEECMKEFRMKTMGNDSVVYMEKVVTNGEDTVTAIRSIDGEHDLYVVGRGEGTESHLTAGLTDWTENPDLGPIGDLLASQDFTSTVSVLVIQQHKGDADETMEEPDSPSSPVKGNPIQQYLNKANNIRERMKGWSV